MAVKYKMDEEAQEKLSRREYIGKRCAALAFDGPWSAIDGQELVELETHASDAVSDILTALFGPAGYNACTSEEAYDYSVKLDPERQSLAESFMWHALESYEGDAEDYTATLVTVDNPLLPKKEPHEDKLQAISAALSKGNSTGDIVREIEEILGS